MCGLLLLMFVVAPLADLYLLVRLGQAVGPLPTVALVLATGFVGAAVIRAQGTKMLGEMGRELTGGRVPGAGAMDAMAVLAGGALLIAPGLLTDAIGLALLFPPTRGLLRAAVRRWLERKVETGALRVSVLRWHPREDAVEDDTPLGLDPSKEIRLPPPDPDR